MAQTWPVTLQDFLNEASFTYTIGETDITSDMDIGLSKKRRRFTKGVNTVSCTIDMERDTFTTLYNFYNDTLNGGVLTFNFDHPITSVASEWRFVAPPRLTPLGGVWFRVSMEWEEIP